MSHVSNVLIFADNGIPLIRKWGQKYYCLPGGKSDVGETGEETARREFREEVGIEIPTNVSLDSFHSSSCPDHMFHFMRATISGGIKECICDEGEIFVFPIDAVVSLGYSNMIFPSHWIQMKKLKVFRHKAAA